MSTGERHEDSSEEMASGLPPLKWPKETFDGMVRNFKFLVGTLGTLMRVRRLQMLRPSISLCFEIFLCRQFSIACNEVLS
ncbi:hypothetical protein Hanom_Chr11g01018321 [Helianthus anomalus]